MRAILFVFAGREANMRLQLPLVRRALELNPDLEYHIWDLARDPVDSKYLRTIDGERVTVHTQFAGQNPWRRFKDVYAYYRRPEFSDCLLLKIDDDVVFFEADRLSEFIGAVGDRRDSVVSALTVNNGVGSMMDLGLMQVYESCDVPLLDVHTSNRYAEVTHQYFFEHWREMVGRPGALAPTEAWLSINMIGLDYAMNDRLYRMCGQPARPYIAGRTYDPRRHRMGDEGVVNTLPRLVHTGFVAAHLSFGPQTLTDEQAAEFRSEYQRIGAEYLNGEVSVL